MIKIIIILDNLVRRDPVTGKTFINIAELNNMRKQSLLTTNDIDPNIDIQETRASSLLNMK